jgi:hypothetical protein
MAGQGRIVVNQVPRRIELVTKEPGHSFRIREALLLLSENLVHGRAMQITVSQLRRGTAILQETSEDWLV